MRIAVANQKGGVGKTDLAVNLSTYLAKKGEKVLLIDMDPQANATDYLGRFNPKFTIADLLLETKLPISDTIIKTQIENLDLIPSSRNLTKAEIRLINEVDMYSRLKKKLRTVRNYDFILIDTPPSLGLLTINALTASDKVLIPIQVHYFPLTGVVKLLNIVNAVKKELNPKLEIHSFVLTMYDRRNNLTFEVEKEVRRTFKDKVSRVYIPINVKLAEAPSHHKPIALYAPRCRGAKAYEKLANQLIKQKKRWQKKKKRKKTSKHDEKLDIFKMNFRR